MSEIPADLQSALADSYDLEKVVGRGGMATVYLARDVRHGRTVAVKVLRPDLAATVGSERFLREIEIAARLTHPNILGLHDSGESEGFLFYVMPFLAGGSLRSKLKPRKTVPLNVAIGVIREVAEALGYAHREGVIHRDIKPENILFSEGHAIVADFGIAKAIITAGGENLTKSGFPLGTPGYMSPEQAAGMSRLDERTDVYGIGCVFYEMLVGEPPGLWLTEEAVRLGRFIDAEPDHRDLLDEVPGRLEQVMVRSLAMRRNDRFATPGEFVDALRQAARRTTKLTDGEVKQVIGRAAELQAEYPTEDGRLTIGVLEDVMADVGVFPDRLREAAEEVGGEIYSGAGYATPEVELIIARAVELEAENSVEAGNMSMGGVEQVGAQVGIAPEHVRNAAGELVRRPGDTPPLVTGGALMFGKPKVLKIDRYVPRAIDAAETATLVEEIRARLEIVGQVSAEGTSLTWKSATPGVPERDITVTIAAGVRETNIHIEENIIDFSRQIAGGFVGLMSGGLLGIGFAFGIGIEDAAPLIATMFAAAGAYTFARSDYVNIALRNGQELEDLGDRLAELAAEPEELRTSNIERPTSNGG